MNVHVLDDGENDQKEIEKQVKKKERTVGKKLTFEKTEDILIQNIKTRKWDTKSTIMEVRVSDD